MITPGADRIKIGEQRRWKMMLERFAIELFRERHGEVLPHDERDEDGVAGRPWARCVMQQAELEWQAIAVAVDIRVDAASVVFELLKLIRRE